MVRNAIENMKNERFEKKSLYSPPRFFRYGMLRDLTQAGSHPNMYESGANPASCTSSESNRKPCLSERIAKENIIRIGEHPLGIGLYLFDCKPEYREMAGHGRQFGVMIDEVEPMMPEAVSLHPDGFKRVDYAMLGMERSLH